MNQIPNTEERCEHGVVAKYCFRCKRPDLAGPIPNIEEWEEPLMHIMESYIMTAELGHLAKDQVKHKQELHAYYTDLVDFIHQQLQKAREEERERAVEIIKEELRTAPLEVQMTKGIVFANIIKRIQSELDQDKV